MLPTDEEANVRTAVIGAMSFADWLVRQYGHGLYLPQGVPMTELLDDWLTYYCGWLAGHNALGVDKSAWVYGAYKGALDGCPRLKEEDQDGPT
jgi:hypothetical protein